ncbi:hypothetical protein C1888_27855 [Pseudomonas sp. GW531-T4]|nr:hypothetical protein C1888_27855 [Pseudomonas sp. GW531-T4]
MCLLARTSSIKSAFLFLCFPEFREEPFFCLAERRERSPQANFRQKKAQVADGHLGLKMHKPW